MPPLSNLVLPSAMSPSKAQHMRSGSPSAKQLTGSVGVPTSPPAAHKVTNGLVAAVPTSPHDPRRSPRPGATSPHANTIKVAQGAATTPARLATAQQQAFTPRSASPAVVRGTSPAPRAAVSSGAKPVVSPAHANAYAAGLRASSPSLMRPRDVSPMQRATLHPHMGLQNPMVLPHPGGISPARGHEFRPLTPRDPAPRLLPNTSPSPVRPHTQPGVMPWTDPRHAAMPAYGQPGVFMMSPRGLFG
jgi:hypothetical protein